MQHFCINSDFFDPVKQSLLLAGKTAEPAAVVSFALIQQYLSGGPAAAGADLGKVSLVDLKTTMEKNELEMEKVRRHVKKERMKEKADEVRAFKLKQQQANLMRKQEEDDVAALMLEIEMNKQDELRARMERERIKEELRQLDSAGIVSLEEERKRELLELAKQKEMLLQKEQNTLRDIQALEQRVKEQELQHREEEKALRTNLLDVDDNSKVDVRLKSLRHTHMQRSQLHGAQAATLAQKQSALQEQRAKLEDELNKIGRGDNQLDDKPMLSTAMAFNLDEETRRLEKLAAQFEQDTQKRKETMLALDKAPSVSPIVGDKTQEEQQHEQCSGAKIQTTTSPEKPSEPQTSPEKEPRQATKSASPVVMDSLEKEVLHRQQSNEALKQPRPTTPRQPPAAASTYTSPPGAYTHPHPSNQSGNPPPGVLPPHYPGNPPPMWGFPPYPYSFPQAPPSYFPQYAMPSMYPQPLNPYMNGYSGLAATGAAIMGYPPSMFPFVPPYMSMAAPHPIVEPLPDPETIKLQQQLEAMKQLKEQRELEMETLRFQQLLDSIQGKMSAVTMENQTQSSPSHEVPAAPVANIQPDEPDSRELKALKLKHAEEMLKLKQQRDLMEEEEKLEALKEQREKRRKEMEDEAAHQEWLANQKRMVMTLRMKKMLAQEQSLDGQELMHLPYDPDAGLALFWDYVLMVPPKVSFLQITYAIYEGSTLRTKHKVLRARECEPHGPTYNRCVLATRRDFDHFPARFDLRLLVEVASVSAPGTDTTSKPTTLGWTTLDLFTASSDGTTQLQEGHFKLPLSHSPLPRITPSTKWNLPTETTNGMAIYVRIVHGAHVDEAASFPIDPDMTAPKYVAPFNPSSSFPAPDKLQMDPSQATISASSRPPTSKATTDAKVSPPPTSTPTAKSASSRPPTSKLAPSPSLRRMPLVNASPGNPTSASIPPARTPTLFEASRKDCSLPFVAYRLVGDAAAIPPVVESNSFDLDDHVANSSPQQPGNPGEGWIDCDLGNLRHASKQSLFARGDGFDVYIDGARSLPDCVTMTKITCFALNSDMSTCNPQQEPTAMATLTSSLFSPSFNLCLEYRAERFNPTLTLLCRIDTVHATTKKPLVVGYTALSLFLESETSNQPTKSTTQDVLLNAGAFQVPIRLGTQLGTYAIDFTAKACDAFLKLPCATLLVRIVPAVKTADGLKCLSRSDVPMGEWVARGIALPPPPYFEKAYDSTASRPALAESKLYQLRVARRRPNTVADGLLAVVDKSTVDTPDKLNAWIEVQLGKKPTASLLDAIDSILQYQPEIGFRVAIDGLVNVPSGCFYKVITCMSPPSPFYQDPKLTEDVRMTVSYDWTSAQSNPEFRDGFFSYRDVAEFPQLAIVFDVRTIKLVKGSWVSSPFGWSYLKLLNAAQCVAAGSFQLPIFNGPLSLDILQHDLSLDQLVAAETSKKKGLISYMPGSSLCVRLEDGCLANAFPQPLENLTPVGIPAGNSSKYTIDKAIIATQRKKKPLAKLIPDGKTEREFDKELNLAFAKDMDISL
ncbi:unnamed protein product [Aphanomyces euteiches]